jgi:hypothetical protein
MNNKEKLKEIVEHIKKENNPNDINKLKNINIDNNYNDALKKIFKIIYKDHLNNIENVNNLKEEDLATFINMYYVEYNKEKLKEIVEHIKKENDLNDINKLKNINIDIDNNYNDAAKKIFKIIYKEHLNNIGNVNKLNEEDIASYINMYYEEYMKNADNKEQININLPNNNQKLNKSKIYNIHGCNIFFGGKQSSPNGKSVGAACGRHALNNLYGGKYFTACITQNSFNAAKAYSNEELNKIKLNKNSKINLTKFAKRFLDQQELTVNENYDIKIIRGILNRFGHYNMEKQNTNSNLNYKNNINNKDILGYLIATGGHYSVIKKCGNNWVFLDSLNDSPKSININFLKKKINNLNNKNRPLVGVYLIKKIKNSSETDETSKSTANAIGNAKENILKQINESMKNNIKFGINYLTLEQLNELINEVKNINTTLNNNAKTKLILKKIIEIKKPKMIKYLNKDYKIESLKQILRKINNTSTNINSIIFTKFINGINNTPSIGIPIGPGTNSTQQKNIKLNLEEYLKKIKLLHNEPDGYYTILEISPKATTDEIKKSYRKLSLIYHPNKLLNKKNNKVYKISTEIFTIIGDCYATLSDSDKKKKYDNLQKNTKKH